MVHQAGGHLQCWTCTFMHVVKPDALRSVDTPTGLATLLYGLPAGSSASCKVTATSPQLPLPAYSVPDPGRGSRPGDLCPGSQLSQPALHRAAGARSKVLLPTGVPLDRWLHYTSHVCLQNGCCLRQGVGMGGPDEGPGVKPPSQHLAAQASVTPPTQLHTHWCWPHTESGSHPMHTLPPHLHTGWPRHPPRTPIHMHSHSCASETRLITEQMPVKAKTSVQTKIPVGGPP